MAVTVDDDFARFGSKSYAINKINSVEIRERQPHGKGGAIICGTLGMLFLFAFIGSFASPDGASIGTLAFTGLFLGLAYWIWQRSKIREYQLFLMTSSSEAQAFISNDEDEVLGLRERIEAAMLHHSRGGVRSA